MKGWINEWMNESIAKNKRNELFISVNSESIIIC